MAFWSRWFRKTPDIREYLTESTIQTWPENVPVTDENIKEASKTHHVFVLEGLPVSEDPDEREWIAVHENRDAPAHREDARDLTRKQPNMRRALDLYVMYIYGNGFKVSLSLRNKEDTTEADKALIKTADVLWTQTLEHNQAWWTPEEKGRRDYRDGESFTRLFERNSDNTRWPPEFRFIDPEDIAGDGGDEQKGIVTSTNDVAKVEEYLLWDHENNRVAKRLKPHEVFHTKLNADSTELRGVTAFMSIIPIGRMLQGTIRTEVKLRNAQSSIVMVRKIAAGSDKARLLLDHAKTSTTNYRGRTTNREQWGPGTVITTNPGTDLEFKQPDNNFSDASPLIKVLIQQMAAATGWTYEQLSMDASVGSFGTALVAESPTLQMIEAERRTAAAFMVPIYKAVMERAIETNKLTGIGKENIWERFKVLVEFAPVVSRDLVKIAQACNLARMHNAISPQQFTRMLGFDPEQMAREIKEAEESGLIRDFQKNLSNQLPTGDDMEASSQSNARDGAGGNQGDGDPIQHKDKVS